VCIQLVVFHRERATSCVPVAKSLELLIGVDSGLLKRSVFFINMHQHESKRYDNAVSSLPPFLAPRLPPGIGLPIPQRPATSLP